MQRVYRVSSCGAFGQWPVPQNVQFFDSMKPSLPQDTVPPVLENFPDDVSTTCSPEGGGPAALPPVANVTAVDPNDASFNSATVFSEQQVITAAGVRSKATADISV
jgi:hypothetical protein